MFAPASRRAGSPAKRDLELCSRRRAGAPLARNYVRVSASASLGIIYARRRGGPLVA